MRKIPYNLQFFAEGDGGGGAGGGNPAQTAQPAQTQTTQQPSADDIASAIFKAAEARSQRAENGVVKSFADQYGMTEAEARAALDKAKAEKAAKLPDDVQKKLDEAKATVRKMQLSTELIKVGAELGLVDPDVALTLIPADKIKIDDKGAVTGMKEALEALKTAKPYLFKGATGQVANVGGAVPENPNTDKDAVYDSKMAAAIRGGRPPEPETKK